MKVAIVHDDFIQFGGAEKLVLAMFDIWPEADVFAVAKTEAWLLEVNKKFNKEINVTWVQQLPFRSKLFRYYYVLYPLAVEAIKLDGYDLVISSSARYAHGVITKPGTVHVAYVNSPARFLWNDEFVSKNFLTRPLVSWHRAWDLIAAQRPDYIVANSVTPANRIEKCWGRKADAIIYPFVELERFESSTREKKPLGDYFLVVSRLNRWKKIELAIEACNELSLPLWIVGEGEDQERLKSISRGTVRLLGRVTEEKLADLYSGCKALIMTQEEDFGITALEAQAAGRPVIAFGKGGALETVRDGITGLFYRNQSKESLKEVLLKFDPGGFIVENCISQAEKFSKEKFKLDLLRFVDDVLRKG